MSNRFIYLRYSLQVLLHCKGGTELRGAVLTVSHLALRRSFSNFANSRRSCRIISSFQISSSASPMNTIPATTPAMMARIFGSSGHSAHSIKSAVAQSLELKRNVIWIACVMAHQERQVSICLEIYEWALTATICLSNNIRILTLLSHDWKQPNFPHGLPYISAQTLKTV